MAERKRTKTTRDTGKARAKREPARVQPRFELAKMSPKKWRDLGLSPNLASAAAGLSRSFVKNHRRRPRRPVKTLDPSMRKFLTQFSLATQREKLILEEVIVFSDVMLEAAVNGCGPEGFGWLFLDLCFEECCNEHDRCYTRGGTEADRLKCDIDFLECCIGAGPDFLAEIYYWAVRTHGQGSFNYEDTAPPGGCSGTCTKVEYEIGNLLNFRTLDANGQVVMSSVTATARALLRQKAREQSRVEDRRRCPKGCGCQTERMGDWTQLPTVLTISLSGGASARCDATTRKRTLYGSCV